MIELWYWTTPRPWNLSPLRASVVRGLDRRDQVILVSVTLRRGCLRKRPKREMLGGYCITDSAMGQPRGGRGSTETPESELT